MNSRALRLIASSALVAGLLIIPAVALGRTSASLSLNVSFAANGNITVALPNGMPVGTTSGSPTVIPAGFYTVLLTGPGGCTAMPHFDLRGPGEVIHDNLNEGESDNVTYNAYFMPNSTYTWTSDAAPSVVHTFVTSSDVQGTPPPRSANGLSSSKHTTVSSSSLIGSLVLPPRGTLVGTVTAAGKLTLAYNGKSVSTLKAGRYTLKVTDESSTTGFMLRHGKYTPLSVTGAIFVGKRTETVRLTAGHWLVMPRLGQTTYSVIVS
jgi:hypothetical protein